MAWYLTGAIFLVGMWGLLAKPNMVKKVMALSIANSAIIVLFIYYGSLSGATAPIEGGGTEAMVDPLPQALMLTAIVVGICIVALALALVYRLYLKFGTLDVRLAEKEAWKLHE